MTQMNAKKSNAMRNTAMKSAVYCRIPLNFLAMLYLRKKFYLIAIDMQVLKRLKQGLTKRRIYYIILFVTVWFSATVTKERNDQIGNFETQGNI